MVFTTDSQFLTKPSCRRRRAFQPRRCSLRAAIRTIAQSCCGEGRVLEVRLVPGQQVRTTGYSVCHCFCFPRDAALPQPRARARQTISDRLFHREHACPGMDTPAGENNNQNTPYLQAPRLARSEATLNDLVSYCKGFGRTAKKSQFDGDAQGARCTNHRRFMPSGRISRRAALPVKTFQTYSSCITVYRTRS